MRAYLTEKVQKEMEFRWKLEKEACELLDVIVAEFKSDPKSVACFDLRIVERSKYVVAMLEETKPY